EILLESADRAGGYWVTRAEGPPRVNLRTVGVYLRADQEDLSILDGRDNARRVKLIADQLENWKSIKSG
ncbi:MAG TPA: nucleotide-binding protein, partial [Thermoanaerobaculia bacterium]